MYILEGSAHFYYVISLTPSLPTHTHMPTAIPARRGGLTYNQQFFCSVRRISMSDAGESVTGLSGILFAELKRLYAERVSVERIYLHAWRLWRRDRCQLTPPLLCLIDSLSLPLAPSWRGSCGCFSGRLGLAGDVIRPEEEVREGSWFLGRFSRLYCMSGIVTSCPSRLSHSHVTVSFQTGHEDCRCEMMTLFRSAIVVALILRGCTYQMKIDPPSPQKMSGCAHAVHQAREHQRASVDR